MKYYSIMRMDWNQKLLSLLGAMVVALGFSSCFNDDQYGQVTPIAYVSFYHGSPETENLTITVDNRIYNHQTFEFGTYLEYGNFYTGNRQFSFRPAHAANSFLDTVLLLKPDIAYSVFLKEQDQQLKPLVVKDSLFRPAEGKALLRMVHLSPDTPEVILLHSGEELLFEDLPFGEVTAFQNVEQGSLNLSLKTAADEEAVVSASNVNLVAGRIYTLVVRGYQNPGGAGNNKSLSLQLIKNYPNF